ncbi:hypothetical protein COOONC_24790 [Cooperia oncophora]
MRTYILDDAAFELVSAAADDYPFKQADLPSFARNASPFRLESYLVLEYILATDLKQHFEIIMTFNEKSSEMELQNESDRLLMAKMVIKMA